MGRRGLLDARLARVDDRFRTPKIAVAFTGCFTVVASFLGQAVLVPISEVGSLAAAIGWLATCLAFCKGAGLVASTFKLKFIGYSGAFVAAMLILMKLVPIVPGSFGAFEYAALFVWSAIGLVLWMRRGELKHSKPETS